jgi:dTMP kinase
VSGARFLVLDGVDGCGKTTQAERLVRALEARGRPRPLHLREPGSTALGEALRALLLESSLALAPAAEALLFCAARRQMLEERVAPALAEGRDVVCERFHPSTYAYQAVAGALDRGRVLALLEEWAGRPAPDLELVLALDVDQALARRARAGARPDRIEGRGAGFQRAVAAGFEEYLRLRPRAARIDAGGAPEAVAARVLAEGERVL